VCKEYTILRLQPQRRTATSECSESAVPITSVEFAAQTGQAPSHVVLAPSGEPVPIRRQDWAFCHVTVPTVLKHQIVGFEGD
jgi:hypothetical protein